MKRWWDESYLSLVEMVAAENGLISSEEELSELFDSDVAESVIKQHGKTDKVALRSAFGDWKDGLCKDGVIHMQQYENYCYVGKYNFEEKGDVYAKD